MEQIHVKGNRKIMIIGGSGFVGTHLRNMIGSGFPVVNVDCIVSNTCAESEAFCNWDIRTPETVSGTVKHADIIVNLAAIHKSPGHPSHEYFETNILGARNVCALAEKIECNHIVFTSSISVYGPGEDEKTEESLFMPNIPYGVSKTIAEYIHCEWQLKDPVKRKLTIIRPSVVFGKGEKGNFTRIATALRKHVFVYPGRKDTIKSWIYVKDLCRLIIEQMGQQESVTLFNACYPQKTTTEHICRAFNLALGYAMPKHVIPLTALNSGAGLLKMVNTPFIRSLGLDSERILKLVKSTNISSQKLVNSGFEFKYDLEAAIKDWAQDCGRDALY